MRAWCLLLAPVCALLLACGGDDGGGQSGGCRTSSECSGGQLCVIAPGASAGACQAAPFSIQLVAPVASARVGAAGVPVEAVVTMASASGTPPSAVALVVNGTEAAAMALQGQDGAVLRYRAVYVPPADQVRTAVIAAVARTPAGALASEGVAVAVDTRAPVLTNAAASCFGVTPCRRDSDLLVTADIQEDSPVTVTASVDLGAATVPCEPNQQGCAASVPLRQYPFPAFSGTVTARLRAVDAAGNASEVTLPAVAVSRLRWEADLRTTGQAPTRVTGAVVTGSGVAVGKADGRLHFLGADGAAGQVLTAANASAPSFGLGNTWVGGSDGKLYSIRASGLLVPCPTTAVTAAELFTPAIDDASGVAFTAGAGANLYSSSSTACRALVSTTDPVSTSPVIVNGKVFVATAQARSTIRRFSTAGAAEAAGATGCGAIQVPLAATDAGNIVAACNTGEIISLNAVTLAATTIRTLAVLAAESPVLFPNGDLLVGTNDRKLHRLTPPSGAGEWVDAWNPVPDLGAAVAGAAIAAPDAAGVVAYAVTAAGQLHAVNASGQTVWSTAGEQTPPLGTFRLSFPSIAPATAANRLPTLYVGSDEGKLYAVVVDSGLDPASPWPKSHHDIRNTGNAATPLP